MDRPEPEPKPQYSILLQVLAFFKPFQKKKSISDRFANNSRRKTHSPERKIFDKFKPTFTTPPLKS